VFWITDLRDDWGCNCAKGDFGVCLAIPGKIVEIHGQPPLRTARVQFGGIVRQVALSFVPEAQLDDYVMVHVGFAISRIDPLEAERAYNALQEMDLLQGELFPAGAELP
jgi:hydrogenase expression/formation protein HypC